ncbi:hypothetical protein GQ600_27270 [Phytophthora cactorum]|nr:hypothetical protein GQ600_27270 [Phytophthora cactorum]
MRSPCLLTCSASSCGACGTSNELGLDKISVNFEQGNGASATYLKAQMYNCRLLPSENVTVTSNSLIADATCGRTTAARCWYSRSRNEPHDMAQEEPLKEAESSDSCAKAGIMIRATSSSTSKETEEQSNAATTTAQVPKNNNRLNQTVQTARWHRDPPCPVPMTPEQAAARAKREKNGKKRQRTLV